MAVAARRIGAENSATRLLMLDTTETMMREEGYAAVSSRSIAAKAGLKPSLVHYYFPTTDDLFLAVLKRGAAQSDAMIEAALATDDPVRALWDFLADASRTALSLEFMALANHRKSLRAAMVEHSEAMRARQAEAFTRLLGDRLKQMTGGMTAAGLAVVLAGIGRVLVMEGGFGVQAGHGDARQFVERWLDELLGSERSLDFSQVPEQALRAAGS